MLQIKGKSKNINQYAGGPKKELYNHKNMPAENWHNFCRLRYAVIYVDEKN